MRDVILCIVGALLFLVDELFEDVAEHIGGVYFVLIARWSLVEVPLIRVEEVEDRLEYGVRNRDVAMCGFELVHGKDATVDKRYISDERLDEWIAHVEARCAKAVVNIGNKKSR